MGTIGNSPKTDKSATAAGNQLTARNDAVRLESSHPAIDHPSHWVNSCGLHSWHPIIHQLARSLGPAAEASPSLWHNRIRCLEEAPALKNCYVRLADPQFHLCELRSVLSPVAGSTVSAYENLAETTAATSKQLSQTRTHILPQFVGQARQTTWIAPESVELTHSTIRLDSGTALLWAVLANCPLSAQKRRGHYFGRNGMVGLHLHAVFQ